MWLRFLKDERVYLQTCSFQSALMAVFEGQKIYFTMSWRISQDMYKIHLRNISPLYEHKCSPSWHAHTTTVHIIHLFHETDLCIVMRHVFYMSFIVFRASSERKRFQKENDLSLYQVYYANLGYYMLIWGLFFWWPNWIKWPWSMSKVINCICLYSGEITPAWVEKRWQTGKG